MAAAEQEEADQEAAAVEADAAEAEAEAEEEEEEEQEARASRHQMHTPTSALSPTLSLGTQTPRRFAPLPRPLLPASPPPPPWRAVRLKNAFDF